MACCNCHVDIFMILCSGWPCYRMWHFLICNVVVSQRACHVSVLGRLLVSSQLPAQAEGPPLAATCARLREEWAALEAGGANARAANEVIHGQKENLMQLLLNEKRRVSALALLASPCAGPQAAIRPHGHTNHAELTTWRCSSTCACHGRGTVGVNAVSPSRAPGEDSLYGHVNTRLK
jgi:hypothetical protein